MNLNYCNLIIDIMLQKIPKLPVRYYHWTLLNIGLIIALSKGMTLLGIIASLLFIAVAAAPVALYLGILAPPPHQIFQDEIIAKLKENRECIESYFERWQQAEEEKKINLVIKVDISIV